jgi:hypothetical protein
MRYRPREEVVERDAVASDQQHALRLERLGERGRPGRTLPVVVLLTSIAMTRRPARTTKSTSAPRSRQ